VEKRDEIQNYLETHRLLSQSTEDDEGKINTSELRSLNSTMISAGKSPRRGARSREPTPATPDLYLSEPEEESLDDTSEEDGFNIAESKMAMAN